MKQKPTEEAASSTLLLPPLFILESIMVELKLIDVADRPTIQTADCKSDDFSNLYSVYDLLLVVVFLYFGLVEGKFFDVPIFDYIANNKCFHFLLSI